MILLSWLVLLCYWCHTAATAGDEASFGVNNNIKCIDHERNSLLKFKRGVKDYCGILSSWGNQDDCCQWHGILCSNRTGHVIMLHLHDNENQFTCLEGKVDPSLFELKHLKYLDLCLNCFNQTIPKFIDSLTKLEHLNFSHGCFFGEIPPQIGNLSKLTSFDLSFNNNPLSGDILTAKSLQWLSHLTVLREINLSGNNLSEATDWIQTINNIPSLRVLYLDDCELYPVIPSSLSYNNSLTALRVVSLQSNHLNDTPIFQWLFNSSGNSNQIEYLDLSDNSISGHLPSAFESMHSLSYLDLSGNSLSGFLPSAFESMHSLSYLDLSYNSFSGFFPSAFENLHSLSHLSLSDNNLEGPIPEYFRNLRSLKVLHLSNNKLHGPLSKIASCLCNLQKLDLQGNIFTDDMSDVFQALSVGCTNEPLLEYLDLSMNQFWGSVPNMISSFSSMRELDLNGNHLNGSISQGIGKLSMLEVLDVSYNSIRDTLNHNHFLNLSNLRELYLSDNHALMVNLSAGWVPPFKLNIISLRSCKLGPSFPDWLLTQTNFSYLDISDTQLSDKIPASFWAKSLSSNLQFLNASHNKIHGVLPNLSATFDIDSVIDLSSNYFEGSIPSFLGNTSSLYLNDNMFSDATHLLCPRIANTILMDLDLSNNLLSGKLPDCWMKFDQLQYLHLENNKFSGNIPTSIGDLKQLNYLHLQNNSFSGDLPARLENCTSLLILDLGYNSLTGYIPPSIGIAFNDLRLLNLRGNHFFGRLPLSLCQLSNLHLLDLAINHISGTIPDCIHNLTAMIKGGSDYLVSVSSSLGKEAISPYEETAVIEWKREQQKFKDTLAQVNYIDLSSNELEGEIPDGITNLTKLISLDLSRNKLRGSIVSNIGAADIIRIS